MAFVRRGVQAGGWEVDGVDCVLPANSEDMSVKEERDVGGR